MKFVKIILGLVAAGVLLVGGFVAGTFITQTRNANIPAQQFFQPTFIPQQQFQPTIVPQQPQVTPVPQTTSPVIPSQGQWGRGGWMMNPQGEWEHGWMMNPQGQSGWGMHDGDYENWNGMHGGMMNGWQSNPNWNATPNVSNDSTTYSTPSTPVSFKDDVQPIFAARCIACHGGTNGLFLDTYENVMKGGVNGAVVFPSDVNNSRLAYYVYSGYMPFRSTPLTSTEIQTILDWIALGAPNN
ncbi:MAG: hypothetical protein HS100_16990 [Anaerolineales bacterium]|nr:hypothetical protein [Anaerolineales bacterium]